MILCRVLYFANLALKFVKAFYLPSKLGNTMLFRKKPPRFYPANMQGEKKNLRFCDKTSQILMYNPSLVEANCHRNRSLR